jgi:hypothetical protein
MVWENNYNIVRCRHSRSILKYSLCMGLSIYRSCTVWVCLYFIKKNNCIFYNYLYNQCLSPLMLWVRISIRARCTTLCDKVCQWLVTGRWFSLGTPVSSTNKTDRHDTTERLLKVTLNTTNLNSKHGMLEHHLRNDSYWLLVSQTCSISDHWIFLLKV